MDVETSDAVHHVLIDEVDRCGGEGENVADGVGGGWRQQDRFDRPLPQVNQAPDHQAAFGDEHAEGIQFIRRRDMPIWADAGIVDRVNFDAW